MPRLCGNGGYGLRRLGRKLNHWVLMSGLRNYGRFISAIARQGSLRVSLMLGFTRLGSQCEQPIHSHLWAVFQSGLIQGSRFDGASGSLPRIWSAAFSPIMIVGALRFPLVICGMMDESTTRKFAVPITRHCGSTTAILSFADPILQVPQGW